MPSADARPDRKTRAIVAAMRAVSRLARWSGRGGTVLGGHLGLRLDPRLIARLASGRRIVAVSATNGKTTTTRMIHAALTADGESVASNTAGSNLATGVVTALAADRQAERAALEVDEPTLVRIAGDLDPSVLVLGNLSDDQLDRHGGARRLAARWRTMLTGLGTTRIVANAEDPLIVWAVGDHPRVTWVAAGTASTRWDDDLGVSPPPPEVTVDEEALTVPGVAGAGGGATRRIPLRLGLPGAFNRANAALAATAAHLMGVEWVTAVDALARVTEVGGRFRIVDRNGKRARLLMAKNPAGFTEMLQIVAAPPTPVVLGVNARAGDGRDRSWIERIDFSGLADRTVLVTGDCAGEISAALDRVGIGHLVRSGSTVEALDALPPGPVDVVCNYSAFTDLLAAV